MHTPDHGPASPSGPPPVPGGAGHRQPPPDGWSPPTPPPRHPQSPHGGFTAAPAYPTAGGGYAAPYGLGPAHPYAPRPAKSGQPGAVIAARICAFVFGGFTVLFALTFGLAALAARVDSGMVADGERVSNEIGIGALAMLATAVLYFVIGGIGGRRSSAVPWESLAAFVVLAGAGAASAAVSEGTVMLAVVGLAPGLILFALLLVPPSLRYYASAPSATG